MAHRLTRIEPAGRPGDYQTFAVRRRPDTTVRATCEQVRCDAWRYGWESAVDEATPLGQMQAAYIRESSGRTYAELRRGDGLTVFRFDSGQRCFEDHHTIPETWVVRSGDWRVPFRDRRLIRHHTSGLDWAEDFGEHTERLADQKRRG